MSLEIGGYIKRKLEEKNMSQIEFANKINLSASTVSRLITGDRGIKRPSLGTLHSIARGLDVPLRELVEHSGWTFSDVDDEVWGDLGEYDFITKRIAEKISLLAEKKKLTLHEIITETGLEKKRLEMPTYADLPIIADYFNVTINYLMGSEDEPNSTSVIENKKNDFLLTIEEQEHIKKYRHLDENDKKALAIIIAGLIGSKAKQAKQNTA